MKGRYYILIVLSALLFVGPKTFAQDAGPKKNRQLWLWFQFTKQLPKKFSIGFQYQVRFDHNMRRFSGENFYAVLGYRINKYLSTQFTYQFFTSPKVDNHTFFISLTGKYRVGPVSFGLRTAYQHVNEYFARRYEPGHEPVDEWRNRVTIKYDFARNWDIYAYCEPYLLFSAKPNAQGIYLEKMRNLIGVDWSFYKYNTIALFYFFQPEFTGKRPEYQHVIGLVYDFNLPKKVNWKKFFHPKKKSKKAPGENLDNDEKDRLYD